MDSIVSSILVSKSTQNHTIKQSDTYKPNSNSEESSDDFPENQSIDKLIKSRSGRSLYSGTHDNDDLSTVNVYRNYKKRSQIESIQYNSRKDETELSDSFQTRDANHPDEENDELTKVRH